jgi:hypothetical protein
MDEQRYRVHGTVTDEDGRELSHAAVTVWHQLMRDRRTLAEGRADEDGRYRISYEPPEHAPGKLLIVVGARPHRRRIVLESPVTEATPDLELDLELQPRDASEHATLERQIQPLLEGLPLVDVVETDEHHDITFLAQETGRSKEDIVRVVLAARLEAKHEIPAAVFYAFLRQRIPAALPSPLLEATQGFTLVDPLVDRIGTLIFALTPDVQTRALENAMEGGLIAKRPGKWIRDEVNRLQAKRTDDVLSQPYLVGKGTLGELLDAAGLPKTKHQRFAQALVSNQQSMRNFWRTIGDGQHGFTKAEASAVLRRP